MKKFFTKSEIVRSALIILLSMAAVYFFSYCLMEVTVQIMRHILIQTGNINAVTGELSPLVDWMNLKIMPLVSQVAYDTIMIIIPLFVWKLMKEKWENIGLKAFRSRFPRDGVAGMAMGVVNCTAIFVILLLSGNVTVISVSFHLSWEWYGWIVAFIFVGVGEELMNRGLIMSTLRRTNNIYLIMLVPSVIFGLIHLSNPGVTLLSVLNIILVGIVFSYTYYKSGNLWMCIGYHITWNITQSIIFGMPVSGLTDMGSMMTTQYPVDNLLNGGSFGIEGGILTTVFSLIFFAFARYYYRNSNDQFLLRGNEAEPLSDDRI